jgi:hypothetical protein
VVLRATLLLIFLLFLALTGVAPAWARLQVTPSLILREEYNDNVFLEETDKQDDFITLVAPFLNADLDSKILKLNLSYGFEFRIYRNQTEEDETDPGDAQRARLDAELFPARDFTVRVLDVFEPVTIDERRPSIEENLVVNRTNLNRLWVNPQYRYRRFATFTATLSYEYENLAYDSSAGDDSDRHTGGLELEKRLSEMLSVVSGYSLSRYNAKTAADYRRDDIYAGCTWRPGKKLTLKGRGGVAAVDRKNEGETTELLLDVSADYALTEEILFRLGYSENVADSVSFGLYRVREATASLEHRRRFPTVATLTFKEEDYFDTNREDLSADIALQTTIPMANRFSLQLRPYVTYFDFRPEDDQVLRYGAGVSIQKDFKYGHLRFGYDHHASKYNQLLNDYRNNIAFLEAAVKF